MKELSFTKMNESELF